SNCDASALWFLSAWSNRLHQRGYAAGVYSSAASGAWLLSEMAAHPPQGYVLPDQIWYAQWNGRADTTTSYIDDAFWADHQRIHQFIGGHNATNGGVTMNIDSNWLDVRTAPVPPAVPGPGQKPAPKPTQKPTKKPSKKPTKKPTHKPTEKPTEKPSKKPT